MEVIGISMDIIVLGPALSCFFGLLRREDLRLSNAPLSGFQGQGRVATVRCV